MIVRARPDIDKDLLLSLVNSGSGDISLPANNSLLFFNSGSAALLFFLRLLGKNKRVGVQVFTCPTVLHAIYVAEDHPVFLDINKDYFTTTYDIISSNIQSFDILILSHLFGIPNPDYCAIKKLCCNKGIVIIDDLCQTFHAKIGDAFLEDISDNYFYSFFFDKPIAGGLGGALKVSIVLRKEALKEYACIERETFESGKRLLRKLFWINRLLDPTLYQYDFRYGSLWEHFLLVRYPLNWDITFLKCALHPLISRVCLKLGLKQSMNLKVRRMSFIQISYILSRMSDFTNNNQVLENYFNRNNDILPLYLRNEHISCSLAKRAIVSQDIIKCQNGIEIALYNWPTLLAPNDDFPNASFVLKHFINIPVWDIDIYK